MANNKIIELLLALILTTTIIVSFVIANLLPFYIYNELGINIILIPSIGVCFFMDFLFLAFLLNTQRDKLKVKTQTNGDKSNE